MDIILKAIKLAGGQSNVAKICSSYSGKNIKQGHVWYWIYRKKEWPAEFVIPLSDATNNEVTRHELRPDIYPDNNA